MSANERWERGLQFAIRNFWLALAPITATLIGETPVVFMALPPGARSDGYGTARGAGSRREGRRGEHLRHGAVHGGGANVCSCSV